MEHFCLDLKHLFSHKVTIAGRILNNILPTVQVPFAVLPLAVADLHISDWIVQLKLFASQLESAGHL